MGVVFAILAILGWGLGDFLIQRTVRKMGDWEALFFISFFGTVILFPFVYESLVALQTYDLLVLIGTSLVIFVAAVLDFDALRVGKIAVIEPVYALEVPITIALATFVLHEKMSALQIALIASLILGIYLVSNRRLMESLRMRTLERGVLIAFFATIGMGAANFLFGVGSRDTTPLMINWFTSAFMAIGTLGYLMYTESVHKIWAHARKHRSLIIWVSAADNAAWIAYSASMLYLPIGIATGLTESYIALAATLGLIFNRERLLSHQKFGLWLAVVCAIALALTVS